MSTLHQQIEAILFASGRKIERSEIARLCKASEDDVQQALLLLRQRYAGQDSPLLLTDEGTAWKLNVKEDFLPLVQRIVQETELSKTVMETLATVAFKAPVMQHEVIRLRTNKAYDHLAELESAGYITREKKGRSKLIRLSEKFFAYFDLPPEAVREKFSRFAPVEQMISDAEKVAQAKHEELRRKEAELKQRKEEEQRQLRLVESGLAFEEEQDELKQLQKKE
ncbi:SMC-Scp complex subunit ScpB [Candidatus Woesearchaeota archaeon]|nr:SMC-Scp complex subunit ScpB [Candidatus Woesearchaeota archaeon]